MKLQELQEMIRLKEVDAMLLAGLENQKASNNLRFITGYTGSFGFAIVTPTKQFFITDFRYKDQARQQCIGFEIIDIKTNHLDAIKDVILQENISVLGFDSLVRYQEYADYQTLGVTLVSLSNVVEQLRISKSQSEFDLIKKACEITDQALEYTLSLPLIGMKEKEVEVILKSKMLELGASGTWDRFIVASGPRGAMPHGMASDKVITGNELVTFDIGCSYEGYTSDLTRTVAFGTVDPKLLEMYEVVYQAQTKAVEAAKAGMTGQELDSICRDYITAKGYGDYFKHGTGHGIGLDVHEGPRVSQANTNPLEVGACITIEPGIYISGLGGVRIEDDLYLTEEGCIVFNQFPKELITL